MVNARVPVEPQKYEPDEDGYPREIVGPWVRDKHARLERYVGISRAVRAKFVGAGKAGATFLDLYSGPGRVRIKDESVTLPGSPLVAWHVSVKSGAAFTQVHVADSDPKLSAAIEARLANAGAPAFCETGPAAETVARIVPKLNPYGLHFAFLDPYNLSDLPFDVIRMLATVERMDILIHVSIQDLQRNLRQYIERRNSPLNTFAPGWRDKVDCQRQDTLVRSKFLEYWRGLLSAEGMSTAEVAELVVGSRNQRLYWLAFAARHERALEFWEKIRSLDGRAQLPLI